MRHVWLAGVVRECEAFAQTALAPPHETLAAALAEFATRVSKPGAGLETAVLRGLLLDAAMRWGEAYHEAYHRDHPDGGCEFHPGAIAARSWRRFPRQPRRAFLDWAEAYSTGFGAAHPLHMAMELRRYLDRHFAEPAGLRTLADRRGVSVRRLQAEFATLTGMTMQRYVRKRRLDAAVALLTGTSEKVEWIARTVGWSSRKNLNRALARHHGLTPADVRASAGRPD